MPDSATRRNGVLIQWNDARGFGFLESQDGGQRCFVHISAYPDSAPRPQEGDQVTFRLEKVGDGRRQAVDVEVLVSAREEQRAAAAARSSDPARRSKISVLPLVVVPVFVVLLFLVLSRWEVPLWGVVIYPAMSVATYFLYLLDKRAALEGSWRVRETTLQVAGFMCGWPGAIIAQQVLRHKNRKWEFQAVFWCLTVLNVAIFLILVWYQGPISDFLERF